MGNNTEPQDAREGAKERELEWELGCRGKVAYGLIEFSICQN